MILRHTGARRFALRGDDAVARLTSRQFNSYKDLLDRFGMEINRKKTFFSTDSVTFCERMYMLRGEHLHIVPSLSLRFTNPELDGQVLRDLHMLFRESGLPVGRAHKCATIGAAYAFDLCKKFKVNPYLPSYYGGLGLPPPDEAAKASSFASSKVRYIDTHSIGLPVQLRFTGTETKKVSERFSELKYSVSTQEGCTHVEKFIADILLPACTQDMINESYREIKLTPTRFMRMIAKTFKDVPSHRGVRRRRYLDMWDRVVKVSTASTRKVFGHPVGYTCSPDPEGTPHYQMIFAMI